MATWAGIKIDIGFIINFNRYKKHGNKTEAGFTRTDSGYATISGKSIGERAMLSPGECNGDNHTSMVSTVQKTSVCSDSDAKVPLHEYEIELGNR